MEAGGGGVVVVVCLWSSLPGSRGCGGARMPIRRFISNGYYPSYFYWLMLTDILKVTALTEEDMRERVEVRLHVLRDHNIKSERYRGL